MWKIMLTSRPYPYPAKHPIDNIQTTYSVEDTFLIIFKHYVLFSNTLLIIFRRYFSDNLLCRRHPIDNFQIPCSVEDTLLIIFGHPPLFSGTQLTPFQTPCSTHTHTHTHINRGVRGEFWIFIFVVSKGEKIEKTTMQIETRAYGLGF